MKKLKFNPNIATFYNIDIAIVLEIILDSVQEGGLFTLNQLISQLRFITASRIKASLSVLCQIGILSKSKTKKYGGVYMYNGLNGIADDKDMGIKLLVDEIQKYMDGEQDEFISLKDEPEAEQVWEEEATSRLSHEGMNFAKWFKSTLPPRVKQRVTADRMYEWAMLYDRLTSKEKYTKEDVIKACMYGRFDAFWSNNFYTPMKLTRIQQSSGMPYIEVFLLRAQEKKRLEANADKELDGVVL